MNKQRFLAIIVALVATAASSGHAAARSIVCESNGGSTQHCAADTSGGVTLAVQYSKASCRQGSSWGYDNRGIWVANGCRAQFDLGDYRGDHAGNHDSKAAAALAIGLIGAAAIAAHHDRDRRDDRDHSYDYQPVAPYGPYGGGGYGGGYSQYDHLTCESRDNRRNYCPANLRYGRVDIERQLSNTPCRYGQNWGWDRRGVWVDDGCRATFVIH
jgi:hypothetical protein